MIIRFEISLFDLHFCVPPLLHATSSKCLSNTFESDLLLGASHGVIIRHCWHKQWAKPKIWPLFHPWSHEYGLVHVNPPYKSGRRIPLLQKLLACMVAIMDIELSVLFPIARVYMN